MCAAWIIQIVEHGLHHEDVDDLHRKTFITCHYQESQATLGDLLDIEIVQKYLHIWSTTFTHESDAQMDVLMLFITQNYLARYSMICAVKHSSHDTIQTHNRH